MPTNARLNDAAIALSRVLSSAKIKFGIFGGYAIAVYGGPRQSKDIDCLAASNKRELLQLLDGKEGFAAVNQTRDDYVAFVWSDKRDRSNSVLVEIFPEQFQGAVYGMQSVAPSAVNLAGTHDKLGTSYVLDPFSVFKGKLRAAETRTKFSDSADLRWLASHCKDHVIANKERLDLLRIGCVLQRCPELEVTFRELSIDVETAKQAAAPFDATKVSAPTVGSVQMGLLSEARPVCVTKPLPIASVEKTGYVTAVSPSAWNWDSTNQRYWLADANGQFVKWNTEPQQSPVGTSRSNEASSPRPVTGQSSVKPSDWNWDTTRQMFWLADANGNFVRWS